MHNDHSKLTNSIILNILSPREIKIYFKKVLTNEMGELQWLDEMSVIILSLFEQDIILHYLLTY